MKKILLSWVILLGVVILSSCGNGGIVNTWDEIEDRGYFVVGLDDTFAPMGFRDTKGVLVGFDIDLAQEVASRLGVEVRFQPIDWDSKVMELNSGTIDMIWNGLTITDERLEEMIFSNPYLSNSQMVMIKNGSTVETLTDLSKLTVGVQLSSAAQDAVEANAIYNDLGSVVKYDNYNLALLELQNGTIDAVVIDEIMGRYIISQNEGLYNVATENFGEEEYGIGFRLEATDLRDKFNEILLAIIADGTAASISTTWFNEDIFLS